MQEVVGSNPTEGKICFSHFTLFSVECEKLFCKTNIKLLKLSVRLFIVYNVVRVIHLILPFCISSHQRAAGVSAAARSSRAHVPQRARAQERVRAGSVCGTSTAARARLPLAPQRSSGRACRGRAAAGHVPPRAPHPHLDTRRARVEGYRAGRRRALRPRAQLGRAQATQTDQRFVHNLVWICID